MEIKPGPFIISYLFEAGAEKVYAMWTDPGSFSNWLGPEGARMTFTRADVKEGGRSEWVMTTADGNTKYGQLNFKIIKPGRLLVYTQNFCDGKGNFIKAPFSDTYPDSLLTTVNFAEEAGKTKLTLKWEIYGHATEEERSTFSEMKELMKAGWTDSFRKLEALLG